MSDSGVNQPFSAIFLHGRSAVNLKIMALVACHFTEDWASLER